MTTDTDTATTDTVWTFAYAITDSSPERGCCNDILEEGEVEIYADSEEEAIAEAGAEIHDCLSAYCFGLSRSDGYSDGDRITADITLVGRWIGDIVIRLDCEYLGEEEEESDDEESDEE